MVDLRRNALADSSSPYLLQHKEDPVHWQEWTPETLAAARQEGKLIFVSIGYATCHWCHVMAAESFRDQETADLLNTHFVPIKVDREQRPDIDRHFLEYVTARTGSAGWPMSVVLLPDGNPVFGGTYFPLKEDEGQPSFKAILRSVLEWRRAHPGATGVDFRVEHEPAGAAKGATPKSLVEVIARGFDRANGGFGRDAKFPPHTTLLFLLALAPRPPDPRLEPMIRTTLDAMMRRGLHDHLQGGFYRYCVDRAWTIPHFEKMLYDQAMHLMTYSLAARLWGDGRYWRTADGILRCLEETFRVGACYRSAFDADTGHDEGATYVWSEAELKAVLGKEKHEAFAEAYALDEGAFEGKRHLIRRSDEPLPEAESLLLASRRKRPQPSSDDKVVTGWNALLGIAFVLHARAGGRDDSRAKAVAIAETLLSEHVRDGKVARSSLGGTVQEHGFLEDHAALLSLLTFLHEDARDERWLAPIRELRGGLAAFRGPRGWRENEEGGDFLPVPASDFDHPLPGSAALAEFATYRTALVLGEDPAPVAFRSALQSDFWNVVALMAQGKTSVIHGPEPLDWTALPPFAAQLPGPRFEECSLGRCRIFPDAASLLAGLTE